MIEAVPENITTIEIHNNRASVTVDRSGGAIVDFHLHHLAVNPLSFQFTKEQMPENNRNGATYKGHFLCLGRWGRPSNGEISAGIPDHGHFANMNWNCSFAEEQTIRMDAKSDLEGLAVQRILQLDNNESMILVHEKVTNINALGRLYNMVQHPTLATPFLDGSLIIDCNASKGFHYDNYREPEKFSFNWPKAVSNVNQITDLRNCKEGMNAVYTYIVEENAEFGWITAYSPVFKLIFGYIWPKEDYHWINQWQDWNDGKIRYRGIEFGTTGIHRPFNEIIREGKLTVFDNPTTSFLDAGESHLRRYIGFIDTVPVEFGERKNSTILNGAIDIINKKAKITLQINEKLKSFLRS